MRDEDMLGEGIGVDLLGAPLQGVGVQGIDGLASVFKAREIESAGADRAGEDLRIVQHRTAAWCVSVADCSPRRPIAAIADRQNAAQPPSRLVIARVHPFFRLLRGSNRDEHSGSRILVTVGDAVRDSREESGQAAGGRRVEHCEPIWAEPQEVVLVLETAPGKSDGDSGRFRRVRSFFFFVSGDHFQLVPGTQYRIKREDTLEAWAVHLHPGFTGILGLEARAAEERPDSPGYSGEFRLCPKGSGRENLAENVSSSGGDDADHEMLCEPSTLAAYSSSYPDASFDDLDAVTTKATWSMQNEHSTLYY
ncbi:uncharacterized protein LOC112344946 [Selaginella moellendorffii]|uniref:uncharacterized protein LOC112344946 n=1 Tax=Selaginella moellendorffii TaxID=88036 RepID=UPI000D1CFF16|nr:uncharacterized protein LOC112344946 [Selaginella moellendorffii]|eukprot:XP_024526401.1 uncharacterized protein LOC112344946 [Selaginella moellendorffii]